VEGFDRGSSFGQFRNLSLFRNQGSLLAQKPVRVLRKLRFQESCGKGFGCLMLCGCPGKFCFGVLQFKSKVVPLRGERLFFC
jgi:hypothetical protein